MILPAIVRADRFVIHHIAQPVADRCARWGRPTSIVRLLAGVYAVAEIVAWWIAIWPLNGTSGPLLMLVALATHGLIAALMISWAALVDQAARHGMANPARHAAQAAYRCYLWVLLGLEFCLWGGSNIAPSAANLILLAGNYLLACDYNPPPKKQPKVARDSRWFGPALPNPIG